VRSREAHKIVHQWGGRDGGWPGSCFFNRLGSDFVVNRLPDGSQKLAW